MRVQHPRKQAEVTRLEQRHIQGEKSSCEDEDNYEPAHIAEISCRQPEVRPQTSHDDQ